MTIIVNGTLVTPDGERRTSLAVLDGKIKMIGEIEPREGDEVLDASGCYVFPGFIDGHTHLDLPVAGTLTADDFASGTAAAVCGGTTTVVDFATQYKGDTVLNALETWKKKAEGKSRANYAFHMAICDWNEEAKNELPALREAGVTSFKVYMADAIVRTAIWLRLSRRNSWQPATRKPGLIRSAGLRKWKPRP